MNILFLYRVYPNYGGVEVVTTILANKFVKDGHSATIVSFEQPHMELMAQANPKIGLEKLEYPVYSASNVQKLRNIVKQKKIDIIINQWGLPYKTTRLCKKSIEGTACRLMSVLHGSPYTSKVIIQAQDKVKSASNILSKAFYFATLKAKEEVIKWSIRYACANNEKYILLSNGFIKPLIDYTRVKDCSNVCAIGNPVTVPIDLNGFSMDNKKRQILYVGRMDLENKRVNRIVEAWETIFKQYPDWELVLVGDGPHKSALVEYVSNHNIDRVRFEGFQVDPPIGYYKDASIFMLTSDLEGFGLVIIESMSYGVVPIVYGSYEAVYDIIHDGESGFITPAPYDPDYTVAKMKHLMDNEQERLNMAGNAMKDASKFTIEAISQQWYALFNEQTSQS